MAIGSWGGMKFSVSDRRILTFNAFNKNTTARIAEHALLNGKTRLEYLGKSPQEVTFSVIADASLGVSPARLSDRLAQEVGNVYPLILGRRRIGLFLLEGVSAAYDIVMRNGGIYRATLNVTMREYA